MCFRSTFQHSAAVARPPRLLGKTARETSLGSETRSLRTCEASAHRGSASDPAPLGWVPHPHCHLKGARFRSSVFSHRPCGAQPVNLVDLQAEPF